MDARGSAAVAAAAAIALAAVAAAGQAEAEERGATLWRLLIDVNVTNEPIPEGRGPAVAGIVLDHAGDPVENATVQIRAGRGAAFVNTTGSGEFGHAFAGVGLPPGEHSVNVVAMLPRGEMGVASTSFRISGEVDLTTRTARQLATEEARRYLGASEGDFAGNPVGLILYQHYRELQERFLDEAAEQGRIDERIGRIDRARTVSEDLTRETIAERNPGGGAFTGFKRDSHISGLDPALRDAVARHMNFTDAILDAAQAAMNGVLAEGGTYEEARAAYMEAAAVSKSALEIVAGGGAAPSADGAAPANATAAAPPPANATAAAPPPANATAAAPPPANATAAAPGEAAFNINGTEIRVGLSGTTIMLSVNGTVLELQVNGTQVTRAAAPAR